MINPDKKNSQEIKLRWLLKPLKELQQNDCKIKKNANLQYKST